MSQAIQGERPARRSQAARTAETRAKILDAVIECITEVGFQRTTAAEITRRAGVTWGAVQHQFGGKNGILRAVVQDSFDRFAERLSDIPGLEAPLEDRVAGFVDGAWEHFGSDDYRSTFEILLSLDAPTEGGPEPVWQGEMMHAWSAIWSGVFADSRLSRRESLGLQRHTISALVGTAALRMIGTVPAHPPNAELTLLKSTLVRELG
jgi:AcrR family transcriptional regulator